MAREVLTVAGTVVGAYFGQPQLGFLIGSMVGNAVDPQKIKGPGLGDAKVQTTQEGAPIPRIWGRAAVAGTVIDRGDPVRVKRETQQGKGGGPVTVEERELMTFAILISEPVENITRIWENDKLVYDVRPGSTILQASAKFAQNFTFYAGDEAQLADPTLEAIHGVGNTPTHRGTSYVVFPLYDYTEKGMAIPRYLFEVATAATPATTVGIGNWWVFNADSSTTTYYSTDDFDTYYTHTLGSAITAHSAAFSGDRVCAMGGNGASSTVYTISDLTSAEGKAVTTFAGLGGFGWPQGGNIRRYGASLVYAGGFSTDRGASWSAVERPSGTSDEHNIVRQANGGFVLLEFNNPRRLWSTTTPGVAASWTLESSIPGSDLGYVTFAATSSSSLVVGLGNIGGWWGMWSVADLATWEFVEFPNNTAGGFPGSDASARVNTGIYSSGRFIVAGDSTGGNTHAPVYTSDNGGGSWTVRALVSGQGVNEISVGGDGRIVCAGSSGTTAGKLLVSEDNGSTWVAKTAPFATGLVSVCYVGTSSSPSTTQDPNAVALSQILTDLHDRVGISASEIDVSAHTATYVTGFVYGSAYNTAEAIRELGKAFLFDSFSADGKLRYPARGGASAFALTDDDLLEDPDILERRAEIELPRMFHLGYQDYDLNYATVKATSRRTSPDVRVIGEAGIQTSVVMSGTEAIQLSDRLHKVAWVDLEGEFTIKIPDNWSFLTPTDCGTVTFRGITKRVRIERIESAEGVMTLTVRHDRASSYTSDVDPIIVRTPATPSSSFPGATTWHFLNAPIFNDADDAIGYYVAGAGGEAGWSGYQLERSVDSGATYTYVSQFSGAVVGTLIEDLGDASRYVTDYQNELRVALVGPSDTLEAATRLQVLRSANAMAVVNPDGTVEIIQFQNMTEESPNVWVGSTLLRGRKNTTASLHLADSPVVMLSSANFVTADASLIGESIAHRPTSIGNSPEESVISYSSLDPALSQTEWAPAYLRLTRSGDNLTATWSPRPRLGTSAYPVHSANFLGYRVTLTKGANTVTFDQTDTTFTYDTSALGAPTVTVSIQGINRYTGAGDAVTDAL